MRPVAMPPAFVSIINFANVNSIQLNQIEFRQSQEGSASCHRSNVIVVKKTMSHSSE